METETVNFSGKIQNQQYSYLQNKQAISFGRTESIPDEFISSAPKPKKNKWLLWASVGIAAVTATIIGIRHFSPLRQIERRFKKLYDDIPGTQKKFKEIFMRENLTEEETINMLKRYEKIEKDGLKQSKEEYWQAVFEEAKANYKFEDFDIKMVLDKELSDKSAGEWCRKTKSVKIKPSIDKKYGFGTIHHELRHAKQDEILKYCSEDDFIRLYGEKTYESLKKRGFNTVKNKSLEDFIKETFYGSDSYSKEMRESIKSSFKTITGLDEYMTPAELAKVPKEKIELSKRFLKDMECPDIENDFTAYWKNAREIDARHIEDTINEMITGLNTKNRERHFNIK